MSVGMILSGSLVAFFAGLLVVLLSRPFSAVSVSHFARLNVDVFTGVLFGFT